MNAVPLKSHAAQVRDWPIEGRHILAQYDEENVVVYQAYRPAIGHHAAAHQRFGGEFSFSRMSWIKPNFLWMMYRSGWGNKEGQEVTLAITIPRTLFDEILALAVPSSFDSQRFESVETWRSALASSEVRLQWDPDHAPDGSPLARRAIQLGLRGSILRRYGVDEVVRIDDVSGFVEQQHRHLQTDSAMLQTPIERVYVPRGDDAIRAIGLDVNPFPVGS